MIKIAAENDIKEKARMPFFFLFIFISLGRPVTVYVDLYIVDIGDISVTNMVRYFISD